MPTATELSAKPHYYAGPRFGVEPAEDELFVAAIYDESGKVIRRDGRRLPYGEAFEHAGMWQRGFGRGRA